MIIGLAGLVLGWAFTGTAKAGEYEVWSCLGPDGQALSMDAWNAQANDAQPGDVWMTDGCATGGPAVLQMTDTGVVGRKSRIDLRFDLPRGARISGYRLNRAMRAVLPSAGGNYVSAVREIDAGNTSDYGCASSLIFPNFNCGVSGSPTDPNDPANELLRSGLDLEGLGVYVACTSIGCTAPVSPPSARFTLFQSVVSVVDNDPPAVTRLAGAITRPQPVRGLADLFVEAADANAGIRRMSISIDGNPGGTIDVDSSGTCAEPFEVARPCPAKSGQVFPVDTEHLSPGFHQATGIITDAAGNTAPFGPVHFLVAGHDPSPPGPDNGTPPVTDPELSLDRDLVQHAPRKAATLSGRLMTAGGMPVAGARLEVMSRSLGTRNTIDTPLEPVTTGADGRFTVVNKALGARRLTVSFAPVAGGPSTRSASATVRSRLSVRFRANPRRVRIGKVVRFRGNIVGGGRTVAGANMEIQAIVDGKWQTVATVAARKNGAFVWKYRFRRVQRNAIFSFRALVRTNPGWPWPTTGSKKIKVRIKVPRR